MRHTTVLELAKEQGVFLPDALTDHWPPDLSAADEKGWFRFQRLYDVARSVVDNEAAVRRLVTEAAEDDAAEGSHWLEIQVDPSGYGQHFGGITPFLELAIDAAADATRTTGVEVRLVVAANRTRHPMDARTLARLASQYAGRGVVGFGLSNDERRGEPHAFGKAFEIARRAGLIAAPHSGELLGAESVWSTLRELRPDRLGHGVRSAEDPRLVARIVDAGIPLEVCPRSNVALGSTPISRRCRCGRCSTPEPRSPSAPTTHCCSARAWSTSTRPHGRPTGSPMRSWPPSPGCRSTARPRRPTSSSGWAQTSIAGCNKVRRQADDGAAHLLHTRDCARRSSLSFGAGRASGAMSAAGTTSRTRTSPARGSTA